MNGFLCILLGLVWVNQAQCFLAVWILLYSSFPDRSHAELCQEILDPHWPPCIRLWGICCNILHTLVFDNICTKYSSSSWPSILRRLWHLIPQPPPLKMESIFMAFSWMEPDGIKKSLFIWEQMIPLSCILHLNETYFESLFLHLQWCLSWTVPQNSVWRSPHNMDKAEWVNTRTL